MHLDGWGQNLDAELVHHQHSPLHLAGLLVVSQHVAEDSWKIRVWWWSSMSRIETLTIAHNSLQDHPGWQKRPRIVDYLYLCLCSCGANDTACHCLCCTLSQSLEYELYTCTMYTLVPSDVVHMWCKNDYAWCLLSGLLRSLRLKIDDYEVQSYTFVWRHSYIYVIYFSSCFNQYYVSIDFICSLL